jgi:hypothetical protein
MTHFKSVLAMLLIPVFAALSGGCSTTHYLTMKADGQPTDDSAFSPRFKEKKCTKVIVMPPSGTARGEFESQIVLFEREFLRHGMTVISGAITGRVVMEEGVKADEKKDEVANHLSDLERALIMAKKTNAEAILQLGEFRWTPDSKWTRFFIATKEPESRFREVSADEWKNWNDLKWSFSSAQLVFVGKLVDVENGEVLATVNVLMPANCALPDDYVATYRLYNNGNLMLEKESTFPYVVVRPQVIGGISTMVSDSPWLTGSYRRAEAKMIAYVAGLISSGNK